MFLHSKYTNGQRAGKEMLSINSHQSHGDDTAAHPLGAGSGPLKHMGPPCGVTKQLWPCVVATVTQPCEGI